MPHHAKGIETAADHADDARDHNHEARDAARVPLEPREPGDGAEPVARECLDAINHLPLLYRHVLYGRCEFCFGAETE